MSRQISRSGVIGAAISVFFFSLAAGLFFFYAEQSDSSSPNPHNSVNSQSIATDRTDSRSTSALIADPSQEQNQHYDNQQQDQGNNPDNTSEHRVSIASAHDPNDPLNQRLAQAEQELAQQSGQGVPDRNHRFSMTGPATITDTIYSWMPYALPLNPAGPQEYVVRWVDGWGYPPQDAEKGTVYVLGHAWSETPLVFNPLSEIVTNNVNLTELPEVINGTDGYPVERYSTSVLNGSLITMTDGTSMEKTWRVTNSFLVDKHEAIIDPNVMASQEPGKITLIACSVEGKTDLNYLVIVEGYLI